MTYELEELLHIRKHREDSALNNLMRDKKEFEKTLHHRKEIARQLFAYSKWRKTEEQRLFEELTRRRRNICEIENYNQSIDRLKEKQYSLVNQLTQAQHKLSQIEADLKESKKQYARCCRKKRKLEEHKKIWAEENRKKNDRLAEKELEDLNLIAAGALSNLQ
jgi:chromosome segregation ATPase